MSPPDFVVAGFMKTGTTSIDAYLRQHPNLVLPNDRKETHFFEKEKNWDRGYEWYKSLFKNKGIQGEVCPGYAKRHCFPGVAERIKDKNPNPKVIFCVRNPVHRALSHYRHKLANGNEDRNPNIALDPTIESSNHYLRCSEYAYQIQPYIDSFGLSNIYVTTSQELRESPQKAITELFTHIGVPPIKLNVGESRHRSNAKRLPTWNWLYNPSRGVTPVKKIIRYLGKLFLPKRLHQKGPRIGDVNIPTLKSETVTAIQNYLQQDVNRLRKITGKDFENWNI